MARKSKRVRAKSKRYDYRSGGRVRLAHGPKPQRSWFGDSDAGGGGEYRSALADWEAGHAGSNGGGGNGGNGGNGGTGDPTDPQKKFEKERGERIARTGPAAEDIARGKIPEGTIPEGKVDKVSQTAEGTKSEAVKMKEIETGLPTGVRDVTPEKVKQMEDIKQAKTAEELEAETYEAGKMKLKGNWLPSNKPEEIRPGDTQELINVLSLK